MIFSINKFLEKYEFDHQLVWWILGDEKYVDETKQIEYHAEILRKTSIYTTEYMHEVD